MRNILKTIKRFYGDVKKYMPYAIRAGRAELKSEVAESHLSWLWWVLNPLLFMCVYTFVSTVVFGKSEQYFSAFIFIGYTTYEFFSDTLKSSVKLVANNKSIVKNVYVPKVVLMFTKLYVHGFKSLVAYGLVAITMVIYRVPITWRIIYFPPLLLLVVILSFAIGTLLLNWGVYVEDLANVVRVGLRLTFYMSGVFYSIEKRIKNPFIETLLLRCNPIAFIIHQMRKCLLYATQFSVRGYFFWLAVSLVLLYIGVSTIYKNENGYVKVI